MTTIRSATNSTVTTEITVVGSEACHFCTEAEAAIASLSHEYPLAIRLVDIRSEEGQEIVRTTRAPMPPVVLVDGRYFSSGPLPVKKLTRALAKRVGA